MKKKIFLFLFIIITSLSLLENVKAEKGNCGAVRYDVTNLNIRDEKIFRSRRSGLQLSRRTMRMSFTSSLSIRRNLK